MRVVLEIIKQTKESFGITIEEHYLCSKCVLEIKKNPKTGLKCLPVEITKDVFPTDRLGADDIWVCKQGHWNSLNWVKTGYNKEIALMNLESEKQRLGRKYKLHIH